MQTKIEIKVKQTIESVSTINVEIPSYWSIPENKQVVKIISEDKVLSIREWPTIDMCMIEKNSINYVEFSKATEITHEMFTEKYEEVINQLNQL